MRAVPNTVVGSDFPANILCIDQFSSLGGGQRSLLDMLPAFSKRGWRASVALPGQGPFLELLRKCGHRTYILSCGPYASTKKPARQMLNYALEFPALVKSIAKLVDSSGIDLLYVNGPRLVPPAAWLAWRRGIPLVFHCHNRLLQPSAIALTGQALELASAHVIACCQHAANPLREYVAPERLRILYNGVADMSEDSVRSPQRIVRIGVVGRIEEEKGQLHFVQAARRVLKDAPECRFKVIGAPMFSGFDYYRKVVAAGEGLPITFIDWQNEVRDVYSELDLLVVPSGALEATTRVILEAYSTGLPVVAFPSGGIPEILEDGQTGFLSKASTVEALAQRILSVVRMDAATLRAVVKKARREWGHRFTLRTYRDGVCSVLAEALYPAVQSRYQHLRNTAGAFTD